MSNILREQSKWQSEKTPIITKYNTERVKVLGEIANIEKEALTANTQRQKLLLEASSIYDACS